MEEFLISNRLNIANEDSALTTFQSTRGTINIDPTVADSTMVKLLHTWQCNEQEGFSDHRYITFCVEKHKIIFHDFNYNGVKYTTSEMGFQHFENNFIKKIKNIRIREKSDLDNTLCELLTLELDTEHVLRKYQDSIVAASKKSFKLRQLMQKTIGFKSVPWWTGELTITRNKINAMRRRY